MKTCPDCARRVDTPSDYCVLHTLVQVLRERGEHTEPDLQRIHARCDVDRLWETIGAVINDLSAGVYDRSQT